MGHTDIKTMIYVSESPLQPEIEQILEGDLNITIPSPVPIPERLRSPHRLVQQTADTCGDLNPDEYGLFWRRENTLDLRVSRASLGRALRICDGLIKSVDSGPLVKAIMGMGDTTAAVPGPSPSCSFPD